MRSIASVKFHDTPDYNLFRSIFRSSAKNPITHGATSSDDDEVILSLRLEKNPGNVKTDLPAKVKPKREKINKFPVGKRRGLRKRPDGKTKQESSARPQVHPQPEVEFETEADFEEARARLDREQSLESMKNPTPAMLEQLERMRTRVSDKPNTPASGSGRRKDGYEHILFCLFGTRLLLTIKYGLPLIWQSKRITKLLISAEEL
jgi:hypothetical protein